MTVHRRNPRQALTAALAGDDPLPKARALRAVGELGLIDLLPAACRTWRSRTNRAALERPGRHRGWFRIRRRSQPSRLSPRAMGPLGKGPYRWPCVGWNRRRPRHGKENSLKSEGYSEPR